VACDRPRSRALTQTASSFAGAGLDPESTLARELVARGGRLIDISEVEEALRSGSRVIVDDPFAPGASGRDQVCVAFSYRFEPAALAARASLQGGSIGLPFAVTAEAFGPSHAGSVALALDLLDAALYATGLDLVSAVRMGADPFVASLLLSHGTVGDVSAMASAAAPVAAMSIRGSHGSIAVNLTAPHMAVAGQFRRTGLTGTTRMLDAFTAGEPMPTLAGAAALAAKLGAEP